MNWYFLPPPPTSPVSSSSPPMSLPAAAASRLPWTRLPTITEAGPTSLCTSRGFGRLVTQVCGHISTFTGWRLPSRNLVARRKIRPKIDWLLRQTSSLSQRGGSLPGESSEGGCGEPGPGSTNPRYGLSPQPAMLKVRLEMITITSEQQTTQNLKRLDDQPEGRETSIGSSPPRCSLVSVPPQHKSVRPSTPGC